MNTVLENRYMRKKLGLTILFGLLCCAEPVALYAQENPLYANLPVGEHAVGFKVTTLTDKSRVTRPLYNFFGERDTTSRYKQVRIHLWYPALPGTGGGSLTYGNYASAHRLSATEEVLPEDLVEATLSSQKSTMEGFFGPFEDDDWKRLLSAPLLARKNAEFLPGRHPLLVGVLRPLSTTTTNELLASNGYVVAMVMFSGLQYPLGHVGNIQDMQKAIEYLNTTGLIDEDKIGTFGFSGSGFSQLLMAMYDFRVRAVADLESGYYGEGLFKMLSSSNFYDVRKLRVPFLHIYGKKLAAGDTDFDQFHTKVYSERHHLLMNYSGLHHWDIATEGRASTTVLDIRGEAREPIKASYELAHTYLLRFFDNVLKGNEGNGQAPQLLAFADSLYSLRVYPALSPVPNREEFRTIVKTKGADAAIQLAKQTVVVDSLAEFLHQNVLNQLAWELKSEGKTDEPLKLLAFATELYPEEAWLWNNLASMHEDFGHKEEAIAHSRKVVDLLKDFEGPEMSFDARIRRHAVARLERLTK